VSPARALLALGILAAALGAGGAMTAPVPPAQREIEAARAAQAAAARRYLGSLEELLPLHEAAVERAETRLARNRELLARGVIAAIDVSASERALDDARAAAARTRAEMAQAAALVSEAEAARELAALPPAAPGTLTAGATLIRYEGQGPWSLGQLPALERFFAERFRRPLPISALGQTAVHDRLGFDHHDALDVAVHPDSAEGRVLMDYLRAHRIPFLAFRAAQPGVATGAHVHVGRPSPHV
jgi:hypothetical protein